MGPFLRRRCPICGAVVEPHCASTTCPWMRCPSFACRSLLSFRRGFGVQRLHGGITRYFIFTDPTA